MDTAKADALRIDKCKDTNYRDHAVQRAVEFTGCAAPEGCQQEAMVSAPDACSVCSVSFCWEHSKQHLVYVDFPFVAMPKGVEWFRDAKALESFAVCLNCYRIPGVLELKELLEKSSVILKEALRSRLGAGYVGKLTLLNVEEDPEDTKKLREIAFGPINPCEEGAKLFSDDLSPLAKLVIERDTLNWQIHCSKLHIKRESVAA